MNAPLRLAAALPQPESPQRLAERHGTPYYLYDMDAALENLRRLRSELPDYTDLFYSMKANSNRGVLAALRPHVDGLDVSSAGEVRLAAAAGYPARAMCLAGPGKTSQELETAMRAGLGLLSLESLPELGRAAAVARALDRRQDVLLRINPLQAPRGFAMKMGGGPSPFGIPEEEAPAAVGVALAEPWLRLVGFHVYGGTQCLDPASIAAHLANALRIGAALSAANDYWPLLLNCGGGFGTPYFEGETALDVAQLGHCLRTTIADARARAPQLQGTRIAFELGRFIMAPFGTYVARVTEVKEARGKRHVLLDGGMSHCLPATGQFGPLIKRNPVVFNFSRSAAGGEDEPPQELCGPLCTPLDSLGRGLRLVAAQPGDLLGFANSGAYAYSASPLLFLGRDTPAELVRLGGRTRVARAPLPATHFCR